MDEHAFILTPTKWLGEGKIQLSVGEDERDFHIKWHIGIKDPDGRIVAIQEMQIKGLSDIVKNHFIISDITNERFAIDLENASLGTVKGKGLIREDHLIAWEFRSGELGFEGFEFYEKQSDGSYSMQAEYATPDQFRSVIKGKIWKKG